MSHLDIPKADLVNHLKKSAEEMADTLRDRFSRDLMFNMTFFLFNLMSKKMVESVESKTTGKTSTLAEHFINTWESETKKQIAPELKDMNDQLNSNKHTALMQAMCDYELPSTEDFQKIYSKAIADTVAMFKRNTKLNKDDDGDDEGEEQIW